MASYDNANSSLRREYAIETAAGNAAVSAKFAQFQQFRLVAVHTHITVAGTSAGAGNSLVLRHGTTVLGTFTLGTNTVRSTQSLDTADRVVESLQDLTVTNGTDATGRAIVVYEYQTLPTASLSV